MESALLEESEWERVAEVAELLVLVAVFGIVRRSTEVLVECLGDVAGECAVKRLTAPVLALKREPVMRYWNDAVSDKAEAERVAEHEERTGVSKSYDGASRKPVGAGDLKRRAVLVVVSSQRESLRS